MLFFECVQEPDKVTFSLFLQVKQVPEAWLPSDSLQAPASGLCDLVWPQLNNLKSLVQG